MLGVIYCYTCSSCCFSYWLNLCDVFLTTNSISLYLAKCTGRQILRYFIPDIPYCKPGILYVVLYTLYTSYTLSHIPYIIYIILYPIYQGSGRPKLDFGHPKPVLDVPNRILDVPKPVLVIRSPVLDIPTGYAHRVLVPS